MLEPKDDKLNLRKNEPALPEPGECALLSEANLSEDWDKPEEDVAWHDFQSTKYGKIQMKLPGNNIMRNPQDNMVYVVSLSQKTIKENSDYTWIDVVDKDKCYFHPIRKGWPDVPPNYILPVKSAGAPVRDIKYSYCVVIFLYLQ